MMLQIEQNLRNDVSGLYKNELLNKFAQLSSEIRYELNQGVEPEEYDRLSKFLLALDASSEVVEQPDDVGEVDPAVAVVVKCGKRLVGSDPGHLVEVEHDIGEVLPIVAVDVLIISVIVEISWRALTSRDGYHRAI